MRIASFILTFIAITFHLDAAPAPQPKDLPEEIQVQLKMYTHSFPIMVETIKRDIRQAKTTEQRDRMSRELEKWERESYAIPVKVLENSLGDARYPRREDQDAIRSALATFRKRYEDAKKQKLFKPEPPPVPTKTMK